jgi:hypothetical protein
MFTVLWAPEAVKRLEVAIEGTVFVDTVCTPEAWIGMMKRYVERLAADEAEPVPEEEV